MDTVGFLESQTPDRAEGRTIDEVFARAMAPDAGDYRAVLAEAERAARLEDAAEARALAFRGIDTVARSQRMERRQRLEDELAEARSVVARCERGLAEIQRADEFDAEQLQLAGELAQRSAPAPVGLEAGEVLTPYVRESHARLVERSRFLLEHGYGAVQRLGRGSQAGEVTVNRSAPETREVPGPYGTAGDYREITRVVPADAVWGE